MIEVKATDEGKTTMDVDGRKRRVWKVVGMRGAEIVEEFNTDIGGYMQEYWRAKYPHDEIRFSKA